MPVIDAADRRGKGWPFYVALGCGGCLVMTVLLFVGMGLFMRYMISRTLGTPTSPPKSVSAYRFHDRKSATTCVVPLPDGTQIRYMQILPGAHRAVEMVWRGHGKVERPLVYYPNKNVRVGLYWYPQKNGLGPYVRTQDADGEHVIDPRLGLTRRLLRKHGFVFAGALAQDAAGYSYSSSSFLGRPTKVTGVTLEGQPAPDMTATFGSDKGIYIGSIVQSGKKLVFVPAKGRP
jgi:hypothetical protein